MSVLDSDVVDFIAVPKDGGPVRLIVADHLEWGEDEDDDIEHIELLSEKVSSYLTFIVNDQLLDLVPDAKVRGVEIIVLCKYELNEYGKFFYSRAGGISEKHGYKLSFELSSKSKDESDQDSEG